MVRCTTLTLLVLVLHDLGWILWKPLVSLPACCTGLLLLAWIAIKLLGNDSKFELAVTFAAFGWLLGNLFWTFSEYMWEEDEPAGFLAHVKMLQGVDPKGYVILMWVATATMVIALLVFVFLVLLNYVCCGVRGAVPGRLVFSRMPIGIYLELSLIPWIVMDFGWCTANLIQEIGAATDTQISVLLCICSIGGVVALVLEVDCARREWVAGQRCSALMYVAEMLWVSGNIVWMLEDVITVSITGHADADYFPAYWTAVVLFGISCLVSLPPVFLIKEDTDSDESVKDFKQPHDPNSNKEQEPDCNA